MYDDICPDCGHVNCICNQPQRCSMCGEYRCICDEIFGDNETDN